MNINQTSSMDTVNMFNNRAASELRRIKNDAEEHESFNRTAKTHRENEAINTGIINDVRPLNNDVTAISHISDFKDAKSYLTHAMAAAKIAARYEKMAQNADIKSKERLSDSSGYRYEITSASNIAKWFSNLKLGIGEPGQVRIQQMIAKLNELGWSRQDYNAYFSKNYGTPDYNPADDPLSDFMSTQQEVAGRNADFYMKILGLQDIDNMTATGKLAAFKTAINKLADMSDGAIGRFKNSDLKQYNELAATEFIDE